MKLEVGEYYLSGSGAMVKIDHFNQIRCRYYDNFDNEYETNGKYLIANPHNKDLIAHIPKELHKHILNEINSYYSDKDFMKTVKSVWSDK